MENCRGIKYITHFLGHAINPGVVTVTRLYRHTIVDYFPLTAQREVFCPLYNVH